MGLSILDFDKLIVKELKLKHIDLFKMIFRKNFVQVNMKGDCF